MLKGCLRRINKYARNNGGMNMHYTILSRSDQKSEMIKGRNEKIFR